MKPLMILTRIILVGIFWSIFFLEGIRVIMLTNWHFDILRPSHWNYAWNLWLNGWVIDEVKEWAFVLIILTFVPVWLTGWAALSLVKWGRIIEMALFFPLMIFKKLFEKQIKQISNTASVKVVKKKKSYKEVRPQSIRAPLEESSYSLSNDKRAALSGTSPKSSLKPTPMKNPPADFNHSLFQFGDSDDTDIDFDLFGEAAAQPEKKEEPKKPEPEAPKADKTNNNKNNRKENSNKKPAQTQQAPAPANNQAPRSGSSNSTLDALKQKGYEVITGSTIKNTLIDFIGVSKSQMVICLNDKEPGDWLADEERFNDEEPLWFSESSHRVSPVRKADLTRLILTEKLADAELKFDIKAFVIIQIGNIINAEDMFDVWKEMSIGVTRIDRGTPKELKLFAKELEDADGTVDKDVFEKLKKLIRSIA